MYRELRDLAEKSAHGAGELLMAHFGTLRRVDAECKGGRRRDLVSAADHVAERYLLDHVPEDHDVLSEEGLGRDRGAGVTWIIDPLDGTVNFLHGFPMWAVSVGVVVDGRLAAGVVHAPVLDQTFTAALGEGCWRNGEKVRVSTTEELDDAMLATGFAYDLAGVPDDNFDNWTTLGRRAAGLRRFGSAALDMAYVACGDFDGFWELHLNPWDVAAGILLVREAGGRVTDFRGHEDLHGLLHSRHVVASNGILHEAIRSSLSELQGF